MEAKERENEIVAGIIVIWISDKILVGIDNNKKFPIFFFDIPNTFQGNM